MHFRIRGNNLQIVKTVVDPATRKTVSKPVGSANLIRNEIGEQARAALTEAELQEVETWIARHKAQTEKRRELEFQTIAATLMSVAEWVQNAEAEQIEPYLGDIENGIRQLRFSLARKAQKKAA